MNVVRFFLAAAVIVTGASVTSVTAQAQTDASHPPTVSDKARADYYRARAALLESQMHQQQLQSALDRAVEALNAACGTSNSAMLDQSGEIRCVAKPKPEPTK